jgi:hypothetical protein
MDIATFFSADRTSELFGNKIIAAVGNYFLFLR